MDSVLKSVVEKTGAVSAKDLGLNGIVSVIAEISIRNIEEVDIINLVYEDVFAVLGGIEGNSKGISKGVTI